MKRVLVFGTFDQLHPGHHAFLQQAKDLGDELIVCLTQDAIIEKLKGRPPIQRFEERKQALMDHELVSHVVPGDLQLGSFEAIQKSIPDIVATGYDQVALTQALNQWLKNEKKPIPITTLRPFKPQIYKSSLLRTS